MEPNFLRLNHPYLLSKFEFGSNCHYWPLRVIKTLTPLCAASTHVRSSGEPLPLQVLTMKLEHFSLLCMCCLCSVCVYQIRTYLFISDMLYLIVTARSSGILKAKQKLGVTFNSDKLGGIDFTKFSKLNMCTA